MDLDDSANRTEPNRTPDPGATVNAPLGHDKPTNALIGSYRRRQLSPTAVKL